MINRTIHTNKIGYIKLHRSILDWEWYGDQNTFRLFIHILLKCNHTAKKWKGINIPRGSFITGRKQLSFELNISERSLRTSLTKLIKTGEITIQTTNKYSIISASNYEKYQTEEANESANNLSTERPTTDQQTTTTKNEKNDKKNIGSKEPLVSDFEECWNFFGKYGNKKAALSYWKKLKPEDRVSIKTRIPIYLGYLKRTGLSKKMFQGWINPKERMWETTYENLSSQTKLQFMPTGTNEIIPHYREIPDDGGF